MLHDATHAQVREAIARIHALECTAANGGEFRVK
jgi:hypothetical protein